MHERAIEICHETVRYLWNRFRPMFASETRGKHVEAMRAHRQWQWHLDVYAKINGVSHYLWRAVHQESEVLDNIVTKTRGSGPASAEYRNLESPEHTWSVPGRNPGWFIAAMEAGKTPEPMAV